MIYVLLLLSGILGGILTGLLGIGGGIVYLFIFTYAFDGLGIPSSEMPVFLIANSLFCVLFASLSAIFSLFKRREVYLKESIVVLISSVVTSILTIKFIVEASWFSYTIFKVVLLVLILYIFAKTLLEFLSKKKVVYNNNETTPLVYSVAGIFSGFIAAVSGLGGGVSLITVLHNLIKMDIKKVRTISLFVIFFNALVVVVMKSFQNFEYEIEVSNFGYILWPISAVTVLGVLLGGNLGVRLSEKLSSTMIMKIYLGFLAFFIVKLIMELFF